MVEGGRGEDKTGGGVIACVCVWGGVTAQVLHPMNVLLRCCCVCVCLFLSLLHAAAAAAAATVCGVLCTS